MLQSSLFALYVVVIGCCLLLSRLSRDRPTVQLLCMPPAQFALYALARRAYALQGGSEQAIIYGDTFLVLFWAVLLLWPLWALLIAWRQRHGRAFWALDGQRWRPVRGPHGQWMARPIRAHGETGD